MGTGEGGGAGREEEAAYATRRAHERTRNEGLQCCMKRTRGARPDERVRCACVHLGGGGGHDDALLGLQPAAADALRGAAEWTRGEVCGML